ncbi:hypothetical protein MLD38_030093 [Melastoma candidum]|uniref:Uncharacterized protein n=1 Tax=Melastoma candidum TaxID=119954 RepID=A0ACB9MKN2_9MYRT|nr:hypothetical protein MLD38_030093 [Melastoma candidum]
MGNPPCCSYYKLFVIWGVVGVVLLGLGSCNGEDDGDSSSSSSSSSSSPTPTVAPMEWKEKESLYAAIQGLVGSSWNGSDLYPDPCGWTPIQGVSCDIYDGLWYVSVMNVGPFYDNSLRCIQAANFTSHLFELKHLTSLSFYECFTTPVSISGLRWEAFSETLTALEFRSNPGLVGGLPPSIGSLKQLQSLVLLENRLGGGLPPEIGNLGKLKRVMISGNRFDGPIPGSFGNLLDLLILDLSGNDLSGPIPSSLGGLASLLKLDLSDNRLEGPVPPEIANLNGSLMLLDIGGNNLTGRLPESIQDMASVKEMVMSNNPELKGDLKGINWGNLQELQVLELTNTGLQGDIPDTMSELTALRHLGLGNNSLTGNPPKWLAALPHISALYLNGNNLTGELEFPNQFYTRMGWRFSVVDNPGLCYRSPITSPSVDSPHGIKPCSTSV